MAKRTPKSQPQQVIAPIQLEVKPDTPAYYVNYIGVSHTPYDFSLSVARIPSPPTPEQIELAKNGKPIPIEATLQLIVPPLLVDGLLKALTDQKEKYARTLSQQVKNN